MKRLNKYVITFLVPFITISLLWSIRDIQAYQIEQGVGFGGYDPKLWPYFVVYTAALLIVIAFGIMNLRSEILTPLIVSITFGVIFFITHKDPFYKDWWEDCFFSRLGYSMATIFLVAVVSTVSSIIKRSCRTISCR